jgi:hypothetical protein
VGRAFHEQQPGLMQGGDERERGAGQASQDASAAPGGGGRRRRAHLRPRPQQQQRVAVVRACRLQRAAKGAQLVRGAACGAAGRRGKGEAAGVG